MIDRFATCSRGTSLLLEIACKSDDWRLIEECVAPEERARAARYRCANDRTLYLAARAALRMVLGRIFRLDRDQVSFDFSKSGKPSVQGGPAFSIAHSGGFAILALAWDAKIGVDVEALRSLTDFGSIATICLTAFERTLVDAADSIEQKAVQVLSFWVRKEAVSKALGLGVALPFDSFSCLDGQAPMAVRADGAAVAQCPWTVADLALPGHVGALALSGATRECLRLTMEAASFAQLRLS